MCPDGGVESGAIARGLEMGLHSPRKISSLFPSNPTNLHPHARALLNSRPGVLRVPPGCAASALARPTLPGGQRPLCPPGITYKEESAPLPPPARLKGLGGEGGRGTEEPVNSTDGLMPCTKLQPQGLGQAGKPLEALMVPYVSFLPQGTWGWWTQDEPRWERLERATSRGRMSPCLNPGSTN